MGNNKLLGDEASTGFEEDFASLRKMNYLSELRGATKTVTFNAHLRFKRLLWGWIQLVTLMYSSLNNCPSGSKVATPTRFRLIEYPDA